MKITTLDDKLRTMVYMQSNFRNTRGDSAIIDGMDVP